MHTGLERYSLKAATSSGSAAISEWPDRQSRIRQPHFMIRPAADSQLAASDAGTLACFEKWRQAPRKGFPARFKSADPGGFNIIFILFEKPVVRKLHSGHPDSIAEPWQNHGFVCRCTERCRILEQISTAFKMEKRDHLRPFALNRAKSLGVRVERNLARAKKCLAANERVQTS